MEYSTVKKFAAVVNTVILALVLGLMYFFHMCDVSFLVYFSIPTALVYVIGYVLIHKNHLTLYVTFIYMWITLYMGVTTVCLGYGYGFHLYCFSMIPITFVTEYMSYRLKTRGMKAVPASLFIGLTYIICTGYVSYFGPIYERDQKIAAFFWIFNALIVLSFLIYYSNYLIRTIISSEEQLREIAHIDRLTRLYNRHYMLSCLEALPEGATDRMLAMADIDNFKKINDTYGHNAGDEVLKTVSDIMKSECRGCEIARWGGEEFLILSPEGVSAGREMLENMRRCIEKKPVEVNGQTINVTVTVGMGFRKSGQNIDSWIQSVDEKLYYGKNNGKNRVID